MSGPELQSIAFSVVGVMIVVESFVPLMAAAWSWFYSYRSRDLKPGQDARLKLLAGIVELLLGVALFVGSRRLAVLWHRLRRQD